MIELGKVDVLIIGSGASGAAVAWSLAETKMRILCLEQGGWVKNSDFPSNGKNYEQRKFTDYSTSPNVRKWPSDYPINDENSPIKVVNFNGVGGATVMYTAHFPRLHPSDFRTRSLDGVGDDWPIDYQILEPFYATNDRMMGVSGRAGDPASPAHQPPLPPLPLGRSGQQRARAMNKLGWHWWPSETTIATTAYEGRAPCINLGQCTPGCAQGAKASTDITYWPLAIRAGVELRTHCRVREITVGPDGMATGAIYYDADGKERFQPAEVVIMACNGVGTPRLLLNSVSKRFPNGLANSSGLVGKNLMFHPFAAVLGYVDEPMDGHAGSTMCLWSQEFYETDPTRGFARGFNFQFNRGLGVGTEAFEAVTHKFVPWGEGHHEAFRKLVGHSFRVAICVEDLPEEHNRVSLDPVLKDDYGIPAPRIDYSIGENSNRILDFAVARGREILAAAGAHHVCEIRPVVNGGWHLLGTARMGTDRSTSVVNEWGRSHDVRNLFIVDGSIFVTAGGVNPTSTIQALALYIADQMKQRLATLFD